MKKIRTYAKVLYVVLSGLAVVLAAAAPESFPWGS